MKEIVWKLCYKRIFSNLHIFLQFIIPKTRINYFKSSLHCTREASLEVQSNKVKPWSTSMLSSKQISSRMNEAIFRNFQKITTWSNYCSGLGQDCAWGKINWRCPQSSRENISRFHFRKFLFDLQLTHVPVCTLSSFTVIIWVVSRTGTWTDTWSNKLESLQLLKHMCSAFIGWHICHKQWAVFKNYAL